MLTAATEEQLAATGLSDTYLDTWRLAHVPKKPLTNKQGWAKLAKELGIVPKTVKTRLAKVRQLLANPGSMPTTGLMSPTLDESHPEKYAAAAVAMSSPGASAEQTARKLKMRPELASAIGKALDTELAPLGRELSEVRLEDMMKRFGTLSRDAMDAITQDKLNAASARDLAIIAGVSVDKWQLLRGQPTSRVDIHDRRQMDELVKMVVKEAGRRGIEIDVTPEGVQAKKSPYRNAKDQRLVKAISSGDPVETLAPA